MHGYLLILGLFFVFSFYSCQSEYAIEVDDKVLKLADEEGVWLVEFYAPWCGYCKKLQPIYEKVAKSFRNSDIRVIKVDGTKNTEFAKKFEIRGYPTIVLIDRGRLTYHSGDRSFEGIVDFVHKAGGDAVKTLSSVGRLNEVRSTHSDGVFFFLVGDIDSSDEFSLSYESLAQQHRLTAFFYKGEYRIVAESNIRDKITSDGRDVVVFKDSDAFSFKASGFVNLSQWIELEMFPAFPHLGAAGVNRMNRLHDFGSYVAFCLDFPPLEDDAEQSDALYPDRETSRKFRSAVQSIAMDRLLYHGKIRFAWLSELGILDYIAMDRLRPPKLLIYRPESQLYWLAPANVTLTHDSQEIIQFLDSVIQDALPASGGTGLLQRIRRILFEIVSLFRSVWDESPLVFALIFGAPCALFSFLIYLVCCMSSSDEEFDEYPDSEEDLADADSESSVRNSGDAHGVEDTQESKKDL